MKSYISENFNHLLFTRFISMFSLIFQQKESIVEMSAGMKPFYVQLKTYFLWFIPISTYYLDSFFIWQPTIKAGAFSFGYSNQDEAKVHLDNYKRIINGRLESALRQKLTTKVKKTFEI